MNENLDLKKFKDRAAEEGCTVFKSLSAGRVLAADETGIAIATKEGKIRISIVDLVGFEADIRHAVRNCLESYKKLDMLDKSSLAGNFGVTYGQLQSIAEVLEVEK